MSALQVSVLLLAVAFLTHVTVQFWINRSVSRTLLILASRSSVNPTDQKRSAK